MHIQSTITSLEHDSGSVTKDHESKDTLSVNISRKTTKLT